MYVRATVSVRCVRACHVERRDGQLTQLEAAENSSAARSFGIHRRSQM